MCGRFRLARRKEILEECFGAEAAPGEADWAARYNVAPGQEIAVVRQADAPHEQARERNPGQDESGMSPAPARPMRRLEQMRWGLIPAWATQPAIGYKMINARAESAAQRPAFRDALRWRRCLIPADGFYEWRREGKEKLPYCFTLQADGVFAFAGLWERWRSPEGQSVESCAILTTPANELVADLHDRMPLILAPEAYAQWLDPGLHNVKELAPLLKPYPASAMRRYRVSTRVNRVANDDAECAAEIASG
jgi:putative SOS response-associated peptidase YedK